MTPNEYIADIKARLISSDLVASFDVVEEWSQPDRGCHSGQAGQLFAVYIAN